MNEKNYKILIASTNEAKIDEYKKIIGGSSTVEIISLNDIGVKGDVEETGETFIENARIKCRYVYEQIKDKDDIMSTLDMIIADDSGLCVKALDGAPGTHTRRCFDGDRPAWLLEQMKDVPKDKRSAKFVCAICAILTGDIMSEFGVIGECDGSITFEKRGNAALGTDFDSVFEYKDRYGIYVTADGKTFAEMSPDDKNSISHRANACVKLSTAIMYFKDRRKGIHQFVLE